MPEKVMIGITSGDHRVNSAILAFAVNLTKADKEREYHIAIVDGAKGYDFPRNSAVRLFLDSECERLWFIDSDTVPPRESKKLLDVDADIVTGLVPVFKGAPNGNPGSLYFNCYTYQNENDKYRPFAPKIVEGEEEVDAGGCAAMVIKRHVLEDRRLWFPSTYEDIRGTIREIPEDEPPPVFRLRTKPNGQILLGEDMDFCDRARRAGYRVKICTGLQFGHLKDVNLLDMMIMQQAMYSKAYEEAMQNMSVGAA